MNILANAVRVYCPRNMAKLLEAMDASQTTMKVDAGIFTAPEVVIIDNEEVTVGTVADSGSDYTTYNVTRGASPTAHREEVNVLGSSPVELLTKTFDGSTDFAGLFVSGESDGEFCYEVAGVRKFYFQTTRFAQDEQIAWPPYQAPAQTIRILCWTHAAGIFSGAFI